MPIMLRNFLITVFVLLFTNNVNAQSIVQQQLFKDLFDYIVTNRPQAPDNSIFFFVFVCKNGKLNKVCLLEGKGKIVTLALDIKPFVKYEQLLNHFVDEKGGNCQEEGLIVLPYILKKFDDNVDKIVIMYPEIVLEDFTRMLMFVSKKSSKLVLFDLKRITFYPGEY